MERDRVLRPLHVDPERIVGAEAVQRDQVEEDDGDDDERQQIMEREEAMQRRIADREAAPEQRHDALPDSGMAENRLVITVAAQ